ncbi:MAG: DUF2807 domain-containing protein [Candidatus Marinimicrobia bacterium]|jgi:hypothetical protein|nr:DUF2807 domain-containing protein [Candidatus Neomarinimicrobiota bacterium]MCK9560130.1 DUF2807 domain-containing protein [Candidatus Neomarinimicrobiota bacterium]
MKTSNKILVGSGLLLATLILIFMIIVRIMLGVSPRFDDSYDITEPDVITNYHFSDFKNVEVRDNWTVSIRQGEQFSIEVTAPQSVQEKARIEVVGDRLIFENDRFIHPRGKLEALVIMPRIENVTSADAVKVKLDDFTCDRLQIKLDGACKVRARNNVITDLDLKGTGATRADLVESVITNANLQVSGAGRVELNMQGGELTGTASGAVKIIYYGSVSAEKIRTSGAVSIHHRD